MKMSTCNLLDVESLGVAKSMWVFLGLFVLFSIFC